MTGQLKRKIINLSVAKLRNIARRRATTITCVPRLDLDHFSSQSVSPRLLRRFPHSFTLVAAVMFYCYWREKTVYACLFASMLVHCVLDLLVHYDDAGRHFYPFLDWKLHSPISYLDPCHYGDIVGKIEIAVVVVLSVWLWRSVRDNELIPDRTVRPYTVLITTNLIYLGFFFYIVRTWM